MLMICHVAPRRHNLTYVSLGLGACALLHILTFLFVHWSIGFRVFMTYSPARSLQDATTAKAVPLNFLGKTELVPLERRTYVRVVPLYLCASMRACPLPLLDMRASCPRPLMLGISHSFSHIAWTSSQLTPYCPLPCPAVPSAEGRPEREQGDQL